MINVIKNFHSISLEQVAKGFPANELVYLLVIDASVNVDEFWRSNEQYISGKNVVAYLTSSGEKISGISSRYSVPMIVSFVNKMPISEASLDEDLTPFFEDSERLFTMMLG